MVGYFLQFSFLTIGETVKTSLIIDGWSLCSWDKKLVTYPYLDNILFQPPKMKQLSTLSQFSMHVTMPTRFGENWTSLELNIRVCTKISSKMDGDFHFGPGVEPGLPGNLISSDTRIWMCFILSTVLMVTSSCCALVRIDLDSFRHSLTKVF